jgi:hypothetical protein
MANGVDPVVNSMEPPSREANVHSTTRDPHGEQLTPRHQAMLPARNTGQHPIHAILLAACRAFATHIVVNARLVDCDRRHAITLKHRGACGAHLTARFCNAKETPARRYRLWL